MYIHLEKLAKTIHSSTFLRSLSLTGQSQLQQQLSPIFLQIQHLVNKFHIYMMLKNHLEGLPDTAAA